MLAPNPKADNTLAPRARNAPAAPKSAVRRRSGRNVGESERHTTAKKLRLPPFAAEYLRRLAEADGGSTESSIVADLVSREKNGDDRDWRVLTTPGAPLGRHEAAITAQALSTILKREDGDGS